MLHLLGKDIDLEDSTVLYSEEFSRENLEKNWQICGGEWWVEDGWLTGRNRENQGKFIFSKGEYRGNIFLDFEAKTVLPCANDITFMWNVSWDDEKKKRTAAYIGGLAGWCESKVIFEKSHEHELNIATPFFEFHPGQIHHIQAGRIDEHCFIAVDGRLVLEVTDPEPIDSNEHGRVGFETYCSFVQIRNLRIRRINNWTPTEMIYTPGF